MGKWTTFLETNASCDLLQRSCPQFRALHPSRQSRILSSSASVTNPALSAGDSADRGVTNQRESSDTQGDVTQRDVTSRDATRTAAACDTPAAWEDGMGLLVVLRKMNSKKFCRSENGHLMEWTCSAQNKNKRNEKHLFHLVLSRGCSNSWGGGLFTD